MTNTDSTDKELHDKLHNHIQLNITDTDDEQKQKIIFLDLVTKLFHVLILFFHSLLRRLKID